MSKSIEDFPRILVCGGRDYADYLCLTKTLEQICWDRKWVSDVVDGNVNWLPKVVIISGVAKGADSLAIDWAVVNWVPFETYPAQWAVYGKKAGSIRNQQMLDEGKPDLVVAFPGGIGTKDMIRRAKKAGVEVIEVD